jgi:hypothetical protein
MLASTLFVPVRVLLVCISAIRQPEGFKVCSRYGTEVPGPERLRLGLFIGPAPVHLGYFCQVSFDVKRAPSHHCTNAGSWSKPPRTLVRKHVQHSSRFGGYGLQSACISEEKPAFPPLPIPLYKTGVCLQISGSLPQHWDVRLELRHLSK